MAWSFQGRFDRPRHAGVNPYGADLSQAPDKIPVRKTGKIASKLFIKNAQTRLRG